ncbi:unnamed protein product [Gongylonema pulchrum]|uniref:PDZ domain-containing protein n=1 Tax=Gongylonema pulchrum TaxID=637853 RepID=A0A183DDN4_9BILA|nr:unnamed protein product [Gongylonema pulchrum]
MLQVGDHLIDVDGIPVTDKEVCRGLLMKNLQAQNFATSVVERAESLEAKQWVQNALFVSIAHAPSVAMNSDVREIAARQRARLKMLPLPKKSCMRQSQSRRKSVRFTKVKPSEYVIASDTEGKSLRRVRR